MSVLFLRGFFCKIFWTLLGYTVAKAPTSPRNSTWFTRPLLLVRGWGLGTRLQLQIALNSHLRGWGPKVERGVMWLTHMTMIWWCNLKSYHTHASRVVTYVAVPDRTSTLQDKQTAHVQKEKQETQIESLPAQVHQLAATLQVFTPPPVFTMTNFKQHKKDSHIGGYKNRQVNMMIT